ncbi:MAG TPA: STAS domain-containing protein [Pseudonocardiaceae bacterium]|jgi:anti-anti-sigma factor|nr:STAS domain-containing protein [Pseudonocardiaceae bacterium]
MGTPEAGSAPNPDTGGFGTRVRRDDAATVLTVRGEVDMVTAPALEKEVDAALREAPALLVVDLTAVRFLSSAGLAVLVNAQARATPDIVLRVVANSPETLRVLELTGLDRTLAVHASLDDALTAGDQE